MNLAQWLSNRYKRFSAETKLAIQATLHCLLGCAIGEIDGLIIGTALGWSNVATVGLAVGLAFLFGYSLSLLPLVKSGMNLKKALGIVLVADTVSIVAMEIVDNGVMLAIPGAMDARITDGLFWGALILALIVAFLITVPVNRFLIVRGRGHAAAHKHH